MEHLNSLDYTETAWESFYAAVDNGNFADKDAELIFETLNTKMRFISFSDYLKRYIYKRAGLTESFESVDTSTYQQIIKASFADNNTPCSFKPTTAKLSALSKNWLTQDAVKRNVVFLLAFGLNMNVEDVNMFLTKALCEQGINPKDPFEVICWYCIKNGYSYLKFEKLYEIYENLEPKPMRENIANFDKTVVLSCSMNSLENDRALIDYLATIKGTVGDSLMDHTAYNTFLSLYDEARRIIARMYNSAEDSHKYYSKDDITESDFERIICSSVPKDRHGNLTVMGKSALNGLFHGKRFSRQHIGEILAKETSVTRFDLITLNFFIFSQNTDRFKNVRERYTEFTDSTDRMLENCFLNSLIVQNPYECFVLMCIVSDDPLGTYADVWEMSYNKEGSRA
ncbi:MAG: hypothetical protein IKR39_03490 [Lachnospiraceae bacterium]|nr:hypothetical protein [Lachnospiraceae bacterium]